MIVLSPKVEDKVFDERFQPLPQLDEALHDQGNAHGDGHVEDQVTGPHRIDHPDLFCHVFVLHFHKKKQKAGRRHSIKLAVCLGLGGLDTAASAASTSALASISTADTLANIDAASGEAASKYPPPSPPAHCW